MSTTKKTNNLECRLLEFFRDMASAKETDNYDQEKGKFLFHMTDWSSSLESLAKLYANPADFAREHIGARGKWGSYYRDMVSQAIDEARATIAKLCH